MLTYSSTTHPDQVIRTVWDSLWKNLSVSTKTLNLSNDFFETFEECKVRLNFLWEQYPASRPHIVSLVNGVVKHENRFRKARTKYWNTLNKIAALAMTPKIETQFSENEIFLEREVVIHKTKIKSEAKKYWQILNENESPLLFKLSYLFLEIEKLFLSGNRLFANEDDKKNFVANEVYWLSVLEMSMISKILSIISHPLPKMVNEKQTHEKKITSTLPFSTEDISFLTAIPFLGTKK